MRFRGVYDSLKQGFKMKDNLFELEIQNLAIDITNNVNSKPTLKEKRILLIKYSIYQKKTFLGNVLKENSVRRLLNEYNDLSAKKVIKYNDDSIETLSYSLSLF